MTPSATGAMIRPRPNGRQSQADRVPTKGIRTRMRFALPMIAPSCLMPGLLDEPIVLQVLCHHEAVRDIIHNSRNEVRSSIQRGTLAPRFCRMGWTLRDSPRVLQSPAL